MLLEDRMAPTSTTRTQLPFPLSWRKLLVAVCLWNALPCLLPASANMASSRSGSRSKFKAAVYEHAVILPRDPKEIVSREEALSVMLRNLEVYSEQAAEAKKQGADILVFPEDGLYGFSFTWDSLTPYLEFIPDPNVTDWVPCDDPRRFPDTEVQRHLSCLARTHSVYIVANMGDKQPCHSHLLPHCNHHRRHHGNGSDHDHHGDDDDLSYQRHVQYNTDVAFDPSGKLVARYHKQNLFFEKQFDTPPTPELSTFDTPFGRWGMFTCFDIMFHDPAVTLVRDLGVANIAFPTAWMDALPLLASVQFHSAFARGMGVNFLAANIHLPLYRFQGSGVYTPEGMASFVHNSSVGSPPQLLVTEINVLHAPRPEAATRTGNRKSATTGNKDISAEESSKLLMSGSRKFGGDENRKVLVEENVNGFVNVGKNLGMTESILRERGDKEDVYVEESDSNFIQTSLEARKGSRSAPPSTTSATISHSEIAFVSELFNDLFNFVELQLPQDKLHVCHHNVCCHLTYNTSTSQLSPSSPSSSHSPDLFALGAFDGLHTYEGTYYLQICALVRCANRNSRQSCGKATSQSTTLFHSLSLRGELQTEFVYPEVLLAQDGDQLALAEAGEWSFRGGEIRTDERGRGLSHPLVAASLFGRWYARDGEVTMMAPDEDELDDISGGRISSVGVRGVVVVCVLVAYWCGY